MSDGRKYYCLCDANCRFETMNKEQILAAIAQAAEHGLVFDTEAAFITKVKEGNAGSNLTFWLGTEAQYNAIVTQGKKDANCFYILTDGGSPAELLQKIQELNGRISALTAADVGAAPAGFGYGNVPEQLGTTTDDNAFIAKLNEQFANTVSRTRHVTFTRNGNGWIGTLWNAGNGYGALTAYCYAGDNSSQFSKLVRNCKNGVWQDWEYENPPLKNNTEYLTTERYNGKPVYVKRVDLGALPNASNKREDIGVKNYSIVSIDGYSRYTSASSNVIFTPLVKTEGVTSFFVNETNGQVGINTNADLSTYTATVTVKYTK